MPETTSSEAAPAVGESLLGSATATTTTTTVAPATDMPAGFEGGAEAWTALDDAGRTAAIGAATERAKADGVARVEAFGKAEGKDAKLAAWGALSKDEKVAAWKGLPDEVKTELGLGDPSRPSYTEFKLPEGMTIDEAGLKTATDLFAESGLSQEQAQKFIDLAVSREKAVADGGVRAFTELQNKWVSEIKADPEIGGDKLKPSLAAAARAIDRLDVPGLREALNYTGAGNHPAVVKAFARLGQMISEDRFRPGAPAAPSAPQSPAEVIYGGAPKGSVDGQ